MLSGKSPADHLPSADWEQLKAIVVHFRGGMAERFAAAVG